MSGFFVTAKPSLARMLAAILLAALPGRGYTQNFDSVSLPVPVDIEGRPVQCPLYLKLEVGHYNISFDKFAAGPKDKAQSMFVTAVQAIRTRDAAKFTSVWTSPDQMKRLTHTTTVSMVENSPANWIEAARSNFDFDHVNVVAEVLAGPDTMFVWETPTKFGTRRDAFYVGSDQKNRMRLSIVSSNAPVLSLIKSAFSAAGMAKGQSYEALANIHLSYQYPIPLAGSGDAGRPVYLQFDGSPMDFPVGDKKVTPADRLLAFVRKAALDLRSGRNSAFANDFTPRSQERLKPWLASIARRNQTERSPQTGGDTNPATAGMLAVMESNVKFVLNASPVFLVFQTAAPGSSWTPDSLTYSYIVREGGTYKIANFSASDDLDDFLQNPALFDKIVLKSGTRTQPPIEKIPDLR
jgi:hypothetical protein